MVASRTALIVGVSCGTAGVITMIVGGAAFSGCEELVKTWCNPTGLLKSNDIYDTSKKAIGNAKIFVDNPAEDVHWAIEDAAAQKEYGYKCTGSVEGKKDCAILTSDCKLLKKLEDKLFDKETEADAEALVFKQKDGKTAVEVAAAATKRMLRSLSTVTATIPALAEDVADDTCDTEEAIMISLLSVGGVLTIVGIVFMVMWWRSRE